jgi:transposase
MPRKGYSPEEIVTKLRQAEVELGRGVRTPLVCKKLGVSEQPYYRWRREYGGLRLEQAKRLKELEREHTRLKRLVADQALVRDDDPRLVTRLIALASDYGRYGYRRVTALLHREGWHVNHKRVARLWRREGLKVPQQQVTRGRLWLADGSCIRRRPTYRHHV